jgi:hypothetical protein
MKRLISSLLLVGLFQTINAQETSTQPVDSFTQSDEVLNSDLGINYFYGSYFSEYDILGDNWTLRTELHKTITPHFNYLEYPFLLKYGVTNKFSVMAGPKVNILTDNTGVPREYSMSMTTGVQYDVNDNLNIYARFNLLMTEQFENEGFNTQHYQGKSRSSFNLGSRFKF